MKILVTGKNGQLGSELQVLAKVHPEINFIFFDSSTLDIQSEQQVSECIQRVQPDVIINCAAYTAVDKAEDEPEQADATNHLAVAYLAKHAVLLGAKLIHISTDYVFSGNGSSPYKPTDPVDPINVYGKTKRLGEEAMLNSNIDGFIIRTSWVYSTFGNNFVKTMLRLGAEKESLSVVNDQMGCPTYAADLAEACIHLALNTNTANKGVTILHFSNTGAISWFDFASEIMKQANLNCAVVPVDSSQFPTKAKRPAYSVMDTNDLAGFGIETRDWKISLKQFFAQLTK